MKTENLTKASESFFNFAVQLRESYNDALSAKDPFAVVTIYSLCEEVTRIASELER